MAKSTKVSGWRSRSSGFLGGMAAIALIVALVGGMALGYEIEKGRVKTTKSSTTAKNKNKTKTKGAKTANGKKVKFVSVRADGTVTTLTAKGITVKSTKGAKHTVTLGKNTIYVKLSGGALSDITADERVIYAGASSLTKARAVIVLPKSAKIGTMVSAATPTTMSIKGGKKTVKITTTGATVSKVLPATAADVAKGAKVIVAGLRGKGGIVVATEIIILPSDSPFV